MSEIQVHGKIKKLGQTVDVGTSGFQKRELVVTTDEQYPQHILINFVQDKCNLLNQFTEGMEVTVSVNLRGREWVNPQGETKYFNDIQGWKVASSQPTYAAQPHPQPQQPIYAPAPANSQFAPSANFEEEADDLPF